MDLGVVLKVCEFVSDSSQEVSNVFLGSRKEVTRRIGKEAQVPDDPLDSLWGGLSDGCLWSSRDAVV